MAVAAWLSRFELRDFAELTFVFLEQLKFQLEASKHRQGKCLASIGQNLLEYATRAALKVLSVAGIEFVTPFIFGYRTHDSGMVRF